MDLTLHVQYHTHPAIVSYGCTSAAGPSVESLWSSLKNGEDCSDFVPTAAWPVALSFSPRACRWSKESLLIGNKISARELLLQQLRNAFHEANNKISLRDRLRLTSANIGVILASTKSFVDDFIWDSHHSQLEYDAMSALLIDFLDEAQLKPKKAICVSNACASSLSAVYLAKQWLDGGSVTDVWLVAADRVGPFVLQGFHSLHALTSERVRPFAKNRSGLQLGDGAAAILFSTDPERKKATRLELQGVGIDTEGYAVTRPSSSGESLKRACMQIDAIQESPPELIIAHGTATPLNDPAEDQAFASLFSGDIKPVVTGSKWCIGHTLGASGAMDLILACESLRRQETFTLANTFQIDSAFSAQYLLPESHLGTSFSMQKALITSLGFGGVNAAATVTLKGGVS